MIRRYWLGACLLTLVVGVLVAWADTRRTDIFNFVRGFRLNGSTIITGASGTGNATVVLPTGSIGAAEMGAAMIRVAYCGENAENGTTYFGPAALTTVEPVLADTACDALDNTTEATADVVLSATLVMYPRYMRCITTGTLGAAETLTFQLRDDTASVSGMTCAITEALTTCEVASQTAGPILAGSATAMAAIQVSNNGDGDESKCIVIYSAF